MLVPLCSKSFFPKRPIEFAKKTILFTENNVILTLQSPIYYKEFDLFLKSKAAGDSLSELYELIPDETNNINLKAISVLVPANFIQGDKVLITFNLQWSEHDKLTTCCFGTCEGFRSYPFHNLYSDLWPYIKEYTNTNTNQSIQVNIKNGFINGFINDVYNGQIYLYCLVTQDNQTYQYFTNFPCITSI